VLRSTSTDRERHWRKILDRCKRSGLNGRAYCRREQLKESAFFFRKRQFRLRGLAPTAQIEFVSLKLSAKLLGFLDVTLPDFGGGNGRTFAPHCPRLEACTKTRGDSAETWERRKSPGVIQGLLRIAESCQPPPSALMRKTLVTRRWPRICVATRSLCSAVRSASTTSK
jgi:hypothetical protein